jgi:MYXO-CTERM domain-containing protein
MSSRLVRVCIYGLGLLTIVAATSIGLLASSTTTPEIDGGTLTTGLGLLTAGVLILRARRRK